MSPRTTRLSQTDPSAPLPGEVWRGLVRLWPDRDNVRDPERLCVVTMRDGGAPSVETWFSTDEQWHHVAPEAPTLREPDTPYGIVLGAAMHSMLTATAVVCESAARPLVRSATSEGRFCYVTTYHDGPESPVRTSLLFRTHEEATVCALVLSETKVPR